MTPTKDTMNINTNRLIDAFGDLSSGALIAKLMDTVESAPAEVKP